MKLTFKKNGFLYNTFKRYCIDIPEDTCQLYRSLIVLAITLIIITVLGALVLVPLVDILAWLIFIIFNGFVNPGELALAGFVIYGIILLIGLLFLYSIKGPDFKLSETNTVKTVKAWAGKYCTQIDWK